MPLMKPGRPTLFRAFVAGQLASLVLFAVCVWWVYRELTIIIGSSKITGSITWGDDINDALRNRLVLFGLTVLLLHNLLGVLGLLLARMSRAAFPRLPFDRLPSLAVLWRRARQLLWYWSRLSHCGASAGHRARGRTGRSPSRSWHRPVSCPC
jgi:hypothetical protein